MHKLHAECHYLQPKVHGTGWQVRRCSSKVNSSSFTNDAMFQRRVKVIYILLYILLYIPFCILFYIPAI